MPTPGTSTMASCTFMTERIWAAIFGSMLWHWSSMKATPASGLSASAPTTSCMIRNSWNGSAAPTIRSSSA